MSRRELPRGRSEVSFPSTLGRLFAAAMCAVLTLAAASAFAASLRVAPVSLKLSHGKSMSTVRVWNEGRKPIRVQARVFRTVTDGARTYLAPTRDVVASPPMATLPAGAENTIRIVRVSGQPVAGKERYRLVIDEVPDPRDVRAGQVKIMVRHAIPVVFE